MVTWNEGTLNTHMHTLGMGQTCKGVVAVTVQHPGTAVVPPQVPSAAAYHDSSPEDIPGRVQHIGTVLL